MSWLDDMEAADPAYPNPGEEDPWAAPGYVPDTSRGLPPEAGSGVSERVRQQDPRAAEPSSRTFTIDEAYTASADAVGLFLEYRDMRGLAEDEARNAALAEISQGLHAWADADEAVNAGRGADRETGPQPGLYELHARLDDGHLNAARELIADWHQRQATYVSGVSYDGPGRDWQLIRSAEANAREIGLRRSVPQPDGPGTPGCEADAAAWGTGRGISPDGPEAG